MAISPAAFCHSRARLPDRSARQRGKNGAQTRRGVSEIANSRHLPVAGHGWMVGAARCGRIERAACCCAQKRGGDEDRGEDHLR